MRRNILRILGGYLCLLSAIIVGVTIGMSLYLFGLTMFREVGSISRAEDKLNENIKLVEDSIAWKLISQNDDRGNEARVSFKFTVRNPTNKDILVDVYQLRILFLDSEGFTLDRYNWTDDFTVPANGEYTYSRPRSLRGGLGEQVAFIEVLGVRSKQ